VGGFSSYYIRPAIVFLVIAVIVWLVWQVLL
jgi:hypothetical protein